ncbi:uncharacterized protein A1O9_13161, partial [Exophiala aquamarina CBS 119918]
ESRATTAGHSCIYRGHRSVRTSAKSRAVQAGHPRPTYLPICAFRGVKRQLSPVFRPAHTESDRGPGGEFDPGPRLWTAIDRVLQRHYLSTSFYL